MDKPTPMTDEEYSTTQHQLVMVAQFVNQLDLPGFLRRISDTHSIAPILDPTLYRKGLPQLTLVTSLARSALPFWREIKKQIADEKEKAG